jgi:hypothetical protein
MKAIGQRLAKLEQATRDGASLYVWVEGEETPEQSIARQFPAGPAENATVIVFRWGG